MDSEPSILDSYGQLKSKDQSVLLETYFCKYSKSAEPEISSKKNFQEDREKAKQ